MALQLPARVEAVLRYNEVDTPVICGSSTSGGVRAGALDAFSHRFRPFMGDEACGDRSPQAHRANTFDMDMKFCDVENLDCVPGELQARCGTGSGT